MLFDILEKDFCFIFCIFGTDKHPHAFQTTEQKKEASHALIDLFG